MQDLFAAREVLVDYIPMFCEREKQDQVKDRLLQTDKYQANECV
jgi:hypothetical protein